jgi:hypothetical protein
MQSRLLFGILDDFHICSGCLQNLMITMVQEFLCFYCLIKIAEESELAF